MTIRQLPSPASSASLNVADMTGDPSGPPLRPGARVLIHGQEYRFTHRTTAGALVFEHVLTRDTKALSPASLANLWREGHFRADRDHVRLPASKARVIDVPIDAFSITTQREIQRKLYYCQELDKALASGLLKFRTKETISAWLETLRPPEGWSRHLSRGPVMKHYANWVASGRRSSVLAHGNARAPKVSPLGEEVVDIIFDVLETYLVPNKGFTLENAKGEIADEIQRRLDSGDLFDASVPSKSTIARYLHKLNRYQVMRAQDGVYEANRTYEPHGKIILPDLPFQHWQIDHTLLPLSIGIEVVDQAGTVQRIHVGQVWLTAVIDLATRMIMAIVIGLDPPSSLRTMRALRMAIEPKERLFAGFPDIENPVRACGFSQAVDTDNGKDFHAKDLTAALMDLGVTQIFSGAYMPWHKPFIERFFRTLKAGLIHKIPGSLKKGTRRRGPKRRDLIEPKPLTIQELERLIWAWICDVYHQRPHAGLYGVSPETAMTRGLERLRMERRGGLPHQYRHPTEYSPLELEAIFAIRVRKKFDHRGIRYSNLYYSSGDLARIAAATGEREVEVRINPNDLGAVLVWDDFNSRWFPVACTMPFYAQGLSLWLHQRVCARVRVYEEFQDQRNGISRSPRIRSIDLPKYLKSEGELLREVLQMTGVPARHKRRDLKAAALHLGRSLDVAVAVARLDALDIRNGRIPPGMGPLIDLVQSSDGTYRAASKPKKALKSVDTYADLDITSMGPTKHDMAIDPLAEFDPDPV